MSVMGDAICRRQNNDATCRRRQAGHSTETNGACGIDLMCKMLPTESTDQTRLKLRDELSQYLLKTAGQPWMWEVMRACMELEEATVEDVGVA